MPSNGRLVAGMETIRCYSMKFESESRRLLGYCGLDWEERCLKFYENKQAATTASAAQVRKPVYRSSLNRWQQYREFLNPAEKILNDAGVITSTEEMSR
jgi:hypothetical protein